MLIFTFEEADNDRYFFCYKKYFVNLGKKKKKQMMMNWSVYDLVTIKNMINVQTWLVFFFHFFFLLPLMVHDRGSDEFRSGGLKKNWKPQVSS